jgi:hypothetical protein
VCASRREQVNTQPNKKNVKIKIPQRVQHGREPTVRYYTYANKYPKDVHVEVRDLLDRVYHWPAVMQDLYLAAMPYTSLLVMQKCIRAMYNIDKTAAYRQAMLAVLSHPKVIAQDKRDLIDMLASPGVTADNWLLMAHDYSYIDH